MMDDEYCKVRGSACDCGRKGNAILKCKRPISDERMREIFAEMWGRMTKSPRANAIEKGTE